MGLRLGIDLGTNSLGWTYMETRIEGDKTLPVSVKGAGVRIFSDGREPAAEGKTGDPLAVTRRIARGARRRRDRMLGRKNDLRSLLLEYGLFPSDHQEQENLKNENPYELRDKAVREPLTPTELSRVLIHLSQRRGFNSNRKGDKTAEKEEEKKGQTKDREDLDKILKEQDITLGQYLFECLKKGTGTRARLGEAKYPQRTHYITEFEKIRDAQKQHHALNDGRWDKLWHVLFDQRDLAAQPKGRCQLYFQDGEERSPKALSSWQRFRIAQNLTNLKIVSADRSVKEPLTKDQIKTLNAALQEQGSMAFSKIVKLLKLPKDTEFNLESDRRKNLEGNKTSALLSQDDYFGARWHEFSVSQQDKIVLAILNTETSETLIKIAVEHWGCTSEQANAIDKLDETKFERGYGRFCQRALIAITDILMAQGISVTEALMQLRGNIGHNQQRDVLEYYGKVLPESMVPAPKSKVEDERIYGKINNPTVHIALNQLRKVINELIATHGRPDEIIVELARDLKLTQDAKDDLNKFQTKNQKKNDEIKAELVREEIRSSAEQVTYDDLLRYKLWEELDAKDCNNRYCPYSGKKIGITDLYSNRVEVEHILPLTRTLDDSYRNKTVSFVEANRFKNNQTPHEAFTRADSPYSYDDILTRIERFPHVKKRRFFADAMDVWEKKEGGFIARQLTDTQYLSKVAKKYLESLYGEKEGLKVRVLPGQLTAKLRHQWGLNAILAPDTKDAEEKAKKNRNDHRHHAIDAIVVACTDQGLLQKASQASGQGRMEKLTFDPPWERDQFLRDVKRAIDGITVSHKQDHGIEGKLNEDTNYGILKSQDGTINRQTSDYERENDYNIVTRKDFISLFAKKSGADALKKVAEIRAPEIRKDLEALLSNDMAATEVEKIIGAYAKEKNIKRVRVLGKQKGIIAIRHGKEKQHVRGIISDGNHHVAFWRMPDGNMEWRGHSYLDVNKVKGDMNKLKPHPAAKLICRVHVGDMARIEKDGKTITCKVKSLAPSDSNQSMTLQEHRVGEGQTFKISLNQPAKYKFRKIFLTPAGKVHDSGSVF